MLDYKDILTKHYVLHLSAREISKQANVSKSGVNDFLKALRNCRELDYPLPVGITNAGIAMKVYGKVPEEGGRDQSYEYPDYGHFLRLMKNCKNMTFPLWGRMRQNSLSVYSKAASWKSRHTGFAWGFSASPRNTAVKLLKNVPSVPWRRNGPHTHSSRIPSAASPRSWAWTDTIRTRENNGTKAPL